MKECKKCGQEKELTEFYKHKRMADGYLNICKECKKKDAGKHYEENRETKLEYQKGYREQNKENIKEYKKNYYEENKEFYHKWGKNHYLQNKEKKKQQAYNYYHSHKKQYADRLKERRANGEFRTIDANHRHKRRAQIKETDITIEWLDELRENSVYCPLCGKEMIDINLSYHPNQKQLDHIKPLNVSGTHTMNNVRYICGLCNISRPKDGSDNLQNLQ
jgi:hypothetical protein